MGAVHGRQTCLRTGVGDGTPAVSATAFKFGSGVRLFRLESGCRTIAATRFDQVTLLATEIVHYARALVH
jgi:hypothetical protein